MQIFATEDCHYILEQYCEVIRVYVEELKKWVGRRGDITKGFYVKRRSLCRNVRTITTFMNLNLLQI